jgi:hypothetical protein
VSDEAASTHYVIDANDEICSVSDSWTAFAEANGACDLDEEHVLGRPLLGYIAGCEPPSGRRW